MTILIVLSLISVVNYFKYFKVNFLSLLCFYFILFIPLLSNFTSVISFGDYVLYSDELFYWYDTGSELAKAERYIWMLINDIVRMDPFYSQHYVVKYINLPIGMIFIVVYSLCLGNKKVALLSVLFLPYLFFILTLNLRDILTLTVCCLLFYIVFYKMSLAKKTIIIVALITLLYYLRWFYVPICLISILVGFIVKNSSKTKLVLYFSTLLALSLLLGYWYFNNNSWLLHLSEVGFYSRDENFQSVVSGNIVVDAIAGILRFIFAPTPLGIVERLMNGEKVYHLFEDLLRFLNQLMYFLFLAYFMIRLKTALKCISYLSDRVICLLSFSILNILIYGIYFLGVTHHRVKVFPQLVLVSLVLLIMINAKKKNENTVNYK